MRYDKDMKVIQNITGKGFSGAPGETVDVSWYTGDSLAQAIAAAAQSAADAERTDAWFTVNSVRIEF